MRRTRADARGRWTRPTMLVCGQGPPKITEGALFYEQPRGKAPRRKISENACCAFVLWRFFLFDACLLSRLGFVGTQMGGVDDHDSNASADAVVDALGEHIILPGGIKVERAGIRPMP